MGPNDTEKFQLHKEDPFKISGAQLGESQKNEVINSTKELGF